MDTVLLVGLSRQMAARRSMDAVANNLANMSTTAFKSESVLFEEYLIEVTNEDGTTEQVSLVLDTGVSLNFEQGRFEPTGNPFDLALHGDGFFQIETDQGIRYTRNGQFRTDQDGQLVTSEGNPVLDDRGSAIVLVPEDGTPSIARDGTISASDGRLIGTIAVVEFANPEQLQKVGNSLYMTDQAATPVEERVVLQGTLESSNVVAILQMSRMMDITRSYALISKMIEKSDELTRETIRKLVDTNA